MPLRCDTISMSLPLVSQSTLLAELAGLSGRELVKAYVDRAGIESLAYLCSFGAESAVLLHLVASVNPAIPVIFINTGRLFGETLRYRDRLVSELGLSDLREVGPTAEECQELDPEGTLHRRDPDACCAFRKVEPLRRALEPFKASLSGRKRYHGGSRSDLVTVELDSGRLKLNPLAMWSADDFRSYAERWKLPSHPLVAQGYQSIGCSPCTMPIQIGESQRAGRWKGNEKTECGIHWPSKRSA